MTLWTVNFGGSMGPIDAIHWRMASLPFTVVSPTIVQATSSAQNDRNPSGLPSAKAALTLATIALFVADMCLAPLFKEMLSPRGCSIDTSHAVDGRRTPA